MMSIMNGFLPVLTAGGTGVWEYDAESGNMEFRNDFFGILGLKQYGISFAGMEELRVLIHADDLPGIDEALECAFAGKNSFAAYRCMAGDGKTVLLESTFLASGKGIVACTVNTCLKQELIHIAKRYQTVVNALFPNFIFVFDENFFFVDIITPEGLRLFHSNEELIGSDARQVYSPEVSELFIVNIRECLRKNQWKEIEYHIDLFGTRYYYHARIIPVEGNRVMCLIQDIGDRVRRMEELLTQRKRAEESDRMKSAFLANMSHEIRTPMNAIIGFSDFLMTETAPEKREKYKSIIHNSSDTLLRIINDILDLSHIEAGMCEFQIEETDVAQVVREAINTCRSGIKPGVIMRTEIPGDAIRVPTDANRVKQILSNLLSNAVKYTDKGYITLKVEESGESLCFSVTDTGCGIPEDKLDLIFNRFEKLNRFIQGTGLGLAISKSLVERLGGHIGVTSQEGMGSTFSFSIPYRHVLPDRGKIGSVWELVSDRRKRLLVAENSEQDFQYIKNILEKNYEVVGVADGEKTVSSFILDKPALILISMPVLTDGNVIRRIRAISTSIPVIAMTTSDFYHDQRWAIENGCTDVISKPFSATKLEEVVMAFA